MLPPAWLPRYSLHAAQAAIVFLSTPLVPKWPIRAAAAFARRCNDDWYMRADTPHTFHAFLFYEN